MRCEDIESLLNEHADAEPASAQRHAVAKHLAICEDCSSAWRTAEALRGYRALPTPAARPTLIDECRALVGYAPASAPRQRSFGVAAGVVGAIAAAIVVVVLVFYSAAPVNRARSVPSLTMSLHETREVSVDIDSAEPLMGVNVRLVLAGGIELAGLDGRRELKWNTDLDAGINRLSVPIVASDRAGGKVLIEVEHGGKQRAFLVQINVDDDDLAHRSSDDPTLESYSDVRRKPLEI